MGRPISELIGTVLAPASYAIIAGEALGGHRVVTANGAAYLADPSLPSSRSIAGITTGAAIQGAPVKIQTDGVLTDEAWAWVGDEPVWLAPAGLMSQTPPLSGYLVQVGVPIGPTQFRIAPQFVAFLGG